MFSISIDNNLTISTVSNFTEFKKRHWRWYIQDVYLNLLNLYNKDEDNPILANEELLNEIYLKAIYMLRTRKRQKSYLKINPYNLYEIIYVHKCFHWLFGNPQITIKNRLCFLNLKTPLSLFELTISEFAALDSYFIKIKKGETKLLDTFCAIYFSKYSDGDRTKLSHRKEQKNRRLVRFISIYKKWLGFIHFEILRSYLPKKFPYIFGGKSNSKLNWINHILEISEVGTFGNFKETEQTSCINYFAEVNRRNERISKLEKE